MERPPVSGGQEGARSRLTLAASSFVTDLRVVTNGTHIGALLFNLNDGSVRQFGNNASFGWYAWTHSHVVRRD